jgi:hypothetical protein
LKNTIIIIAMILGIASSGIIQAQDYHTGLGIRGGFNSGISIKHFYTTDIAIEGVLSTRWNGFKITGLAEWHRPIFDTQGMYFYYGGGAHIGIWDTEKDYYGDPIAGNSFFIGVDGVIGLEYAFQGIPLSLGLDWKPGFEIISDFGFTHDEIALSIRYLFR